MNGEDMRTTQTIPARRGGFLHGVLALALLLFACLTAGESRADIVLNDAAGREVHLAAPARRIVSNDSLILLSLALVDPDPVGRIAGWAVPQRIDRGIYASFARRFPQIAQIPEVGAVVPGKASTESILSVRPDLFVVSLWQPEWQDVTDTLTRAGIPVLFLDGPANAGRDPGEATAFSITLLGQAVGQPARAGAYADFVRARYRLVQDRLKGAGTRPKVLIDAFAGTECCSTPGRDNRLTQMAELAGGTVVGVQGIAGYEGRLNPEAVLALDPDVYIGTGGARLVRQGGLTLGSGVDAESAQASLTEVLSQSVRRDLRAVREKRAYGVSHQLSITALSVLTFECFARWIHPDLFADIDPSETLADINRRFMAAPLEGTFWTGLADQSKE